MGGTGLYIDSVLFDYQFPDMENKELRIKNKELSLEQLVDKLREVDPRTAETIDLKNPRRVMRAIETAGSKRSKTESMRPETLALGLSLSKESIHKRIYERIEKMLGEGLIGEVKYVGETFGWDNEAMAAPAYRAFKDLILGDKTVEEAAEEFLKRDMALAKRQLTWFKRNKDIHWLDAEDSRELSVEATELVKRFIA